MKVKKNRALQKLQFFNSMPFDMLFFVLVLLLLIIGLIMVFSASFASAYYRNGDSYFYIKKQLLWAVMGVVAMLVISRLNYNILRIVAIPLFAVSVLFLILVMIVPSEGGGAGRWLIFGPIRFQPSEITKFAVILLMSLYVAKNYTKMKKFKTGVLIPLAICLSVAVLVLAEPHLSGAILIVVIGLSIMVVGGTHWKWLALFVCGLAAGAGFVILGTDYMKSRVEIWQNPASDPLGKGFQTLQSLYAIGSGGLFGLGIGRSRQKYLYIPEPQNDFIFSIVCEELGFIGAIIIICLFILLCYRGFVIAWSAPDKFGALMVVGIVMQVAVQTVLNIAVVTNTIPVTGISLPFFSYGGTALMLLLAQMGVVLSVSRQSRLKKD